MLEPSHRLLLIYDVHPERFQQYYLYMRGEFIPAMQKLGLYMIFAWQVLGEGYPERQIEFICETPDVLRGALADEKYQSAIKRLKSYTTTYRRKIVRFENRYQF